MQQDAPTQQSYPRSELANLGPVTAARLAPRIRAFAAMTRSYPADTTYDGWRAELELMARGLDLVNAEDPSASDIAERDAALALLGRRFVHLWS